MKTDPDAHLNQDKPSLDQLFALKKAERPDSVYWGEFEDRLRQRQLAAMIEPAPWWYGTALFLRRSSVRKFGVTAAVAASIAVFTTLQFSNVGEFVVAGSSVALRTGLRQPSNLQSPSTNQIDSPSGDSTNSTLGKLDRLAKADLGASSDHSAPDFFSSTGDSTENSNNSVLSQPKLLAVVELIDRKKLDANLSSGTFSLAASGASFPAAVDPATALLEPVAFADEVQRLAPTATKTAADDPLDSLNFDAAWQEGVAAMPKVEASNLSPRQARLLAGVEDSSGGSSSKSMAHVRERVVHRLEANDELYASASRVGVSGDRLSLKF